MQIPITTSTEGTTQTTATGSIDLPFVNPNNNVNVELVSSLTELRDSVLTYARGSDWRNITSSTLVNTGACKLTGIWVSSVSGTPTIKVWDSTTAAGSTLIGTFTPTAATMYQFPTARAVNGLYVTLSGTVDCTVFFDPTEV